MAAIRRLARRIATQFQPTKIILFGSHAYGKPHRDSDVDLLIVMPAEDEITQACHIAESVDPSFPMDLIVRTPATMKWRLQEGDGFLTDIVTKGKVLYEKNHHGMGTKSRRRSGHRAEERTKSARGS
jgi:predicted nucleotidyltransferase